MKKSYLSFILPSLLSGCTGISGSNNITDADTPALVFVDGQISDSAAVLAHTQQRLSTPAVATTPQMVSSPGTIKTMESFSESRPLPSPSISQNFSKLIMTGTAGAVPVTFLPTVRNRTVSQWIKTLLPPDWQFKQENAATPKLNTRLASWSANDQWTRSLNRLLEEQHLWGHLNWADKTLIVTTSSYVPAVDCSGVQISPPSVTVITPEINQSSRIHSANQIKPRNPFHGSTKTNTDETAVLPGNKPAQLITGTPVTPVAEGKEWRAAAGTTLKENITRWAEETKCESIPSSHWMVLWPSSVKDYRLDAPLFFRGSFESVIGEVFELYRTAQTPLYAQGSRIQCIVTVSDTRDGQ
ncbi:TPA: TcpQ domain-containing protein [Salmonella enterica]|nr:TcpQ domain-containing protein [Salmonella enterica]